MIKTLVNSIKNIGRIKLTYTKEMQEQDELWDKNIEDVEKMAILQIQLIEEAKKKGLRNHCAIDELDDETITYIFNTEEEKATYEWVSSSKCKIIKQHLETLLNKEDIMWE